MAGSRAIGGVCLLSRRIVTPSGTVAGHVSIRQGSIAAVSSADPAPGDAETIDLGDDWIVPGYIDTHVHGGGGAQCNTADPDEVAAVAAVHAAHGTTALLATTVSAPVDELVAAAKAIARVARGRGAEPGQQAAVLGSHLEGPFLSPARPGAMDPETFVDPDPAIVQRLLGAGEGTVSWMTLAPELPGAVELVGGLVEAGVVASIGHSDATYEQTLAAVNAGARAATHVFNSMGPLHHRAPGVLGAVLDLPDVSIELICDGAHLHPAVVRLAYHSTGPDRVRLVTDAMAAAGMPDGDYRLGAARVSVTEGRATLDGVIAGSTLTMDAAVANAVRFLGIGLEDAVAMASANPARLLGLQDRKGALSWGLDADLVVLGRDLRARATMVGGRWIGDPPAG